MTDLVKRLSNMFYGFRNSVPRDNVEDRANQAIKAVLDDMREWNGGHVNGFEQLLDAYEKECLK